MAGERGYVTSATAQINEATARLLVRSPYRDVWPNFDESALAPKLRRSLRLPSGDLGRHGIAGWQTRHRRWSNLSRTFVRMTPALADSGHGFSGLGARLATKW